MSTGLNDPNACRWCGLFHTAPVCPTVKALEYHPDGSVKRVEFKTAADYPPMAWPYSGTNPNWSTSGGTT